MDSKRMWPKIVIFASNIILKDIDLCVVYYTSVFYYKFMQRIFKLL